MEPGEFTSMRERECWERGCAGKDAYPTESAAASHALFLYRGNLRTRDRIPRQEWNFMLPYLCDFSEPENPHWHLRHPK